MVLKQQPRLLLKRFRLNQSQRRFDPAALIQDRASRCAAALVSTISPVLWSLTAGSTSVLTATSPPNSERQPLRWRRAPGLKVTVFSALRNISVRELNTSSRVFQYDLKPDIPKAEGRKLFFDTHAVVRLLEENGFSTQQAEVLVKVLMGTTNSNMDLVYTDMVTKVQQEIMLQQVMSKIAVVKKDMIILEKSEFSTLLTENEKLKIQLLQLKVQLADVMNKVRSNNILDLNLEKSRAKELKAQHEKKLLETRTEILEMTAEQDRHLTQINMKIDTEVAGLKTMLESHKLDTIKYLAGTKWFDVHLSHCGFGFLSSLDVRES
ncbi:mitochondrial calcium uniporter regulator 1 isoform X1 [Poecilia reticulata]|uniref:mitochondrial calcium uniporter regulator 1 isoform X1 n=1 Tax=Poecilia reticulata TaxID=8081 RepID=UPI0004A47A3B|nr:PREDICTED: mitochondrial calcium uniporter regulator 1-like isoform X1 [Poecilia reticulata]